MKHSLLSTALMRIWIVSFILISLYSYGFSQDVLEITTNANQETLFFNYSFSFSEGSPSSIIAIEKPEDSIFINAVDSDGREYEPLVIGDFYRFEIDNRDITNLDITFTSDLMYENIYNEDELLLYVNSNVDLDRVIVNLDIVRDFDDVSDIFPRNYEYRESSNTITITQNGILEDNLFRINYTSNSSDLSFWLIIMLSLPIVFFLALFAILKVKPYSRDKKLDEFIGDKEQTSKHNNNNNKTEKTSDSKLDTLNTNKSNDNSDSFVYSFNEEDNNTHQLPKTNEDTKLTQESTSKELINETQEDEHKGSKVNLEIKNDELENYIKKYFTENEQDVIRTIHNKEGIVQQEILDVLPIFTKSTLSKILSKLESRKMLERVRVGKINKLYIGEKLKTLVSKEHKSEAGNEHKPN